jgi:hypothetical protein
VSFQFLEVDGDKFTVHFHLKDGACGVWVNMFGWDAGFYFNSQAFKDGELLVVAHFQTIPVERAPLRSVLRVSRTRSISGSFANALIGYVRSAECSGRPSLRAIRYVLQRDRETPG